jgi:hypothetical protein
VTVSPGYSLAVLILRHPRAIIAANVMQLCFSPALLSTVPHSNPIPPLPPRSAATPRATGPASPCALSSHRRAVPPSSWRHRPFLRFITTEHPTPSHRGRLLVGSRLRSLPSPASTMVISALTQRCSSTLLPAATTTPSRHHHRSPLLSLHRHGGAIR